MSLRAFIILAVFGILVVSPPSDLKGGPPLLGFRLPFAFLLPSIKILPIELFSDITDTAFVQDSLNLHLLNKAVLNGEGYLLFHDTIILQHGYTCQ